MFSLLRARPPDPKIPVSENNCVVLQSFLCPVLLSGPLCRNRGDTGWATGESTLAATWSGPWPWTPTASISFNLTEPIQLSAPPWERRPEASLRRWELRGEPPGPQSPPQGEARLGTSVCKARFSGETLELNYTGDSLGSSNPEGLGARISGRRELEFPRGAAPPGTPRAVQSWRPEAPGGLPPAEGSLTCPRVGRGGFQSGGHSRESPPPGSHVFDHRQDRAGCHLASAEP